MIVFLSPQCFCLFKPVGFGFWQSLHKLSFDALWTIAPFRIKDHSNVLVARAVQGAENSLVSVNKIICLFVLFFFS